MKKLILSITIIVAFAFANTVSAQTPFSVTVNPTPTAYVVGSSATSYCAGSGGVIITLGGSDMGIKYSLYKNVLLNDSLPGAGTPLAWPGKLFGTYTVVAKNTTTGCTANMSGNAVITENPIPVFTLAPVNSTICEAGTTTFSATATVTTGTISGYYWEEFSGGVWHSITNGGVYSGVNTSTLTLTGVINAMNANQYRCIATTTTFGCTTTSNAATLTVNPLPVITTQPMATTACDQQTNVTISVVDNAPLHQWQLSTNNGVSWNNVTNGAVYSGANTSVLNILSATATMNGYQYRCIVTSGSTPACPIISTNAILTVNNLPVAYNVGPATAHYCFGTGGVTITLSNSTSGVDYQLYKGVTAIGLPVPGNGSPLTWPNQLFGTYTIVATNTTTLCSRQMTGSAIITEDPLPTAGTVVWSAPCSDGQVTVTINNLTGTSPWTIKIYDEVLGNPGTVIHTQSVSIPNPTISFTPNWVGTQNKYIWMQDANGCSAWK